MSSLHSDSMRLSDDEYQAKLHAARVQKVMDWLDWLDDASRRFEEIVLSRRSELPLASEAGADPDPRLRPCEHRSVWMRGRLCLACDNTGLRRATQLERDTGLAYDPYMIDPPRERYGVVRDESAAAKRTRDLERLNAAIADLQRNARLRAGVEVHEDAVMRLVREVQIARRGHPILRRLETALAHLRQHQPELYRAALSREPEGLDALVELLPGRLQSARRASPV